MEKVCVVICNWNKVQDVLNCAESVFKSSYTHFDVVVVDNGSDPHVLQEVKAKLPSQVILLENAENRGGSAGFNRGLRYALEQGGYGSIWLLDNDVIVDSHCLEELLKELRSSEKNGMIGSLILQWHFPDLIQELGAQFDPQNYTFRLLLRNKSIQNAPPESIVVDYVAACSLIVDVKKLQQIGLMDEQFFIYFDDVEWCQRFKEAGYGVRATPHAKVWHKGGGGAKSNSIPRYYEWRNKIYFFLQSIYSEDELDQFIDRFLVHNLFTLFYGTLRQGKINAFKSVLWATMDAFSGKMGKIQSEKILPLDTNVFGSFATEALEKIEIIADVSCNFKVLQNFLTMQTKLTRPVPFYKKDMHMAESFESLLTVTPLHEMTFEHGVLIICDHILSLPSSLEEELAPILSQKGEQVYYLDDYSNLCKGYHEMSVMRQNYVSLAEFLKKDLRKVLKNFIVHRSQLASCRGSALLSAPFLSAFLPRE